jgi:hypothetical protein
MNELQMQVVGFGVAGLGLAVASDRTGELERWLDAGVVFLERGTAELQWRSLNYAINSNSAAADFLAAVRPDGLFAAALQGVHGRALAAYGQEPVPLRLAAEFFDDVAHALRSALARHARSAIRYHSTVARLVIDGPDRVSSYDAHGRLLAQSACAVLATGGEQDPRSAGALRIGSELLLRGEADDLIEAALQCDGPIVIAGASHSGFSCADYLLQRYGSRLAPGRIVVLWRHPVRQFYASLANARAAGLSDEHCCVDPATGQVNRLSGIRGDARTLCQRVLAGAEPRVRLLAEAAANEAGPSALAVYAGGYAPRQVPLFDGAGRALRLARSRANLLTTGTGNLVTADGVVLRNLYGLGLGHAMSGTDGPQVGVNFFHGAASEAILAHARSARLPHREPVRHEPVGAYETTYPAIHPHFSYP